MSIKRSLFALALVAGCKAGPADPKAQLGPFAAEQWREADEHGQLVKCYLLSKDSNAPVRICGEGTPAPDNQTFLIEAVTPAPGKFTEDVGAPVDKGWYILRSISGNKIEAWKLGKLGEHQWLAGGKSLLGVDTDAATGTTHVRVIDPGQRLDRLFDVPLTAAVGWVTIEGPDDNALLLAQKIDVATLILVHAPLTNCYVEVLDVPNSKNLGAKKLWRRGNEARAHNEPFKMDASIASNVTWKGEDPQYEGSPLGPFDSLDERKKPKKVKAD